MRRVTGPLALAALTLAAPALLGGCARTAAPQDLASAPARRSAVAQRSPAVECSTTWVVIATVSKCGSGGFKLGVAAE